MDERRIDLSALDPGRDPARYERMVRAVLERAAEPAPHPFAAALVSRGRLAVAAAVAIAAAAWIPVLAVRRESATSPATSTGADPVATVAAWAEAGEIPAGADPYRVLGVNDER